MQRLNVVRMRDSELKMNETSVSIASGFRLGLDFSLKSNWLDFPKFEIGT